MLNSSTHNTRIDLIQKFVEKAKFSPIEAIGKVEVFDHRISTKTQFARQNLKLFKNN